MEKVRSETINEWFFPCNVTFGGKILPAPEAAREKAEEMRKTWYVSVPRGPEIPLVALGPVITDEREGYRVRTIIVYKPSL